MCSSDLYLIVAAAAWALFIAAPIPAESSATPPLPNNGTTSHRMQAYDCSQPRTIEDVTFMDFTTGCLEVAASPIVNRTRVRVQLLQEERVRRLSAVRCHRATAMASYYCGVYDHMTFMPQWSRPMGPKPGTIRECRLWTEGRYNYTTQKVVRTKPLRMNAVNRFKYMYLGQADYDFESQQGWCLGGIYNTGRGDAERMVMAAEELVTLSDETLSVLADGSLVSSFENQRLPCRARDGACVAGDHVYVWEYEEEWCPLANVQEFDAEIVANADRKSVV